MAVAGVHHAPVARGIFCSCPGSERSEEEMRPRPADVSPRASCRRPHHAPCCVHGSRSLPPSRRSDPVECWEVGTGALPSPPTTYYYYVGAHFFSVFSLRFLFQRVSFSMACHMITMNALAGVECMSLSLALASGHGTHGRARFAPSPESLSFLSY